MPTPDTTPDPSTNPDPPITLVTGQDRLTQREQLESFLQRAAAAKQPIRMRLPLTLYDSQSDSRGYVPLRDAAWNFHMPADKTTAEDIERLIQALGSCIAAIAEHGATVVLERLESPPPSA